MIRIVLITLVTAAFGFAQEQPMSDEEQAHLRQVLSAGSSSAVDLIHALETHLAKFPDSPKKNEMERGILKAAIQGNDNKRTIQYGERVLKLDPDDVTILDPVCRALALDRTGEKAKPALEWSKHYEQVVRGLQKEMPADTADRGRRKDELDKMLGHALLYQAMALGAAGDNKADAELARKSFEVYPSADPALELARRLALLGKGEEAVSAYADAFTVADPRTTEFDRAEIRRRMGELFQKVKGSEAGLGEIVLQAYDRNSALLAQRRLALKQFDPNLGITNPMEFTLNSASGEKLPLSSLSGKVVVMDFWATWCGPCRAQHPLYDQVKQHFASDKDVVFLAISTDEDHTLVKPFLEEQGWKNAVYFEDGLARALRVSSIPTTVVFDKTGGVISRMNGFNPDNFVDVLTDRIKEARGGAAASNASK